MTRRRLPLPALSCALALAGCAGAPPQPEAAGPSLGACAQRIAARLYLGLEMPGGRVTEAAWQGFVDEVVTPRFPDGFTVLRGEGQWRGGDGRITREPSRVLEVIGAEGPARRQALAEIVDAYKARFRQEAVLVTESPVRACL